MPHLNPFYQQPDDPRLLGRKQLVPQRVELGERRDVECCRSTQGSTETLVTRPIPIPEKTSVRSRSEKASPDLATLPLRDVRVEGVAVDLPGAVGLALQDRQELAVTW